MNKILKGTISCALAVPFMLGLTACGDKPQQPAYQEVEAGSVYSQVYTGLKHFYEFENDETKRTGKLTVKAELYQDGIGGSSDMSTTFTNAFDFDNDVAYYYDKRSKSGQSDETEDYALWYVKNADGTFTEYILDERSSPNDQYNKPKTKRILQVAPTIGVPHYFCDDLMIANPTTITTFHDFKSSQENCAKGNINGVKSMITETSEQVAPVEEDLNITYKGKRYDDNKVAIITKIDYTSEETDGTTIDIDVEIEYTVNNGKLISVEIKGDSDSSPLNKEYDFTQSGNFNWGVYDTSCLPTDLENYVDITHNNNNKINSVLNRQKTRA